MKKFCLLFIVYCLLFIVYCFAQTIKISGKVTDALTNESIPFANITFQGTNIGTTSDINGNYLIETSTPSDTLIASFIGYQRVLMRIIKTKSQVINFS